MQFRKYRDLGLPSESGYEFLMELQQFLNKELLVLFKQLSTEDRDTISRKLIEKVETLVDQINKYGYRLYRSDYAGTLNYENSEQTYSNKNLNIHFHGFSAQISWDKW